MPKRILLIEDDVILAAVQSQKLLLAGYEVTHISNGEDAIDFCNAKINTVDVILMDIDLGDGIDGTLAAQEILKIHSIPLIFVSSHTEREVVEKTENITNYGYVVKNSDITVLDASIKMAFKLFGANQKLTITSKALQDINARLELAQAVAKIGSWETDLTSMEVIWSPETFRIFELEPDHFGSSHPSFLEFVHSNDRVKVDAAFIESFSTTSQNSIEHRIITPDGQEKYVEERWQIHRDVEGKPIRAFGTCQDITGRIILENTILNKVNFLNTVTNVLPAMMGYWTSKLVCTFANSAYLDWFGKTNAQMIGITMQELVGEALFELNKHYIDGVLTGENQNFERTLTKSDGSLGYVLAQYIADKVDGEVIGFIALVTDITFVKQKEKALIESEEKWRTLFEAIPVGISLLSKEHKLTESNSTLKEILKSSSEELQKGDIQTRRYFDSNGKLLTTSDFPSAIAVREQRLIRDSEIRIEINDRDSIWTKVTAAPLNLPNYDCVVVTTDITKQKLAEIALQEKELKFQSIHEQTGLTNNH